MRCALTQWGWTLARDPEGSAALAAAGPRGEHRQRARLAVPRPDRGTDPDHGLAGPRRARPEGAGGHRLPGSGQVGGPGRIVTTADPGIRASLPPGDDAVRASLGSVSCAVHAKGKTALEVAEEIARAASAALPEQTRRPGTRHP